MKNVLNNDRVPFLQLTESKMLNEYQGSQPCAFNGVHVIEKIYNWFCYLMRVMYNKLCNYLCFSRLRVKQKTFVIACIVVFLVLPLVFGLTDGNRFCMFDTAEKLCKECSCNLIFFVREHLMQCALH